MRSKWAVAALSVLLLSGLGLAADLPDGWEKMEIEAKWSVPEGKYAELKEAFPDGGERYGYKLEVRWGGIPRKYVDSYYDSAGKTLSAALHSLRWRTRYTSDLETDDGTLRTLESAGWRRDWERVQYKSTPVRMGAVWFREEAGDCRTWDRRDRDLCSLPRGATSEDVVHGAAPDHEAIDRLREDHPDLDLPALRPVLEVVDYRYRVILHETDEEGDAGREVFELSLDRVATTDLATRDVKRSVEAELEVVADPKTEADVRALLDVAARIQEEFGLAPSTTSKGGNEVSDIGDP